MEITDEIVVQIEDEKICQTRGEGGISQIQSADFEPGKRVEIRDGTCVGPAAIANVDFCEISQRKDRREIGQLIIAIKVQGLKIRQPGDERRIGQPGAAQIKPRQFLQLRYDRGICEWVVVSNL